MTADQPRRGDITTADQLAVLFGETGAEYVVVAEHGWRPWLVTSTADGDLYAWSWREEADTEDNVANADTLDYPLTLLALPPGEQPPSVEDARAEAERIVREHPGYEYRKERGGDVCMGCGAKIYSLDGYGRHVAEKTLAASRVVSSDPPLVAAPCCDSVEVCRAITRDRDRWRRIAEARTADLRDPAVPSDHTATTEDAAADVIVHHYRATSDRCACGPLPLGSSHAAHVVQVLGAAGLLATARPDTATETEWGVRDPAGRVTRCESKAEATRPDYFGWIVVRREVTAWTEADQ